MRRMEMRKVDTWLESTREYALQGGDRERQKEKETDMSEATKQATSVVFFVLIS